MEELKIVINESDDTGIERLILTDKPMCGVMGIIFSDTKQTTIEIKDSKENGICSPSSKPIK